MKTITKIVLLVLAIAACLGVVAYLQLEKYETDITDEELAVIEDYLNANPPGYCLNFIALGEEKTDKIHTLYYGVVYENKFRVSGDKKIEGTFYTEKSKEQLRECKSMYSSALCIIKTKNSGDKLEVIDESYAISSEGGEKDPDAPNWLMIMKGKHYKASEEELRAMDEDDKARISELGYEVIDNY